MKASLYKKLRQFGRNEKVSFHIPGHKGGVGFSARFKRNAFKIDVTELDETDDLMHPHGILADALQNAAEVFGADRTFYLTNGTSSGIEAAIMGCAKRGDTILLDRTCHRSVIAAVVLGGLNPVFVYPEFDKELGFYRGIKAETIIDAIENHPESVGAVITSPNYYGMCAEVLGIARALHVADKFLIVDEAHGAHFKFSDNLPKTALESEADVSVQSAHKTLPVLGQCSLLHVRGNLVDSLEIERYLHLIQTTSPSYLLMTSIDEGISGMSLEGSKNLDMLILRLAELRQRVNSFGRIVCLNEANQDVTRLVVDFSSMGFGGEAALKLLNREYGIYPEFADEKNVVFIVTAANSVSDIQKLESALMEISQTEYDAQEIKNAICLPRIEICFTPQTAFCSDGEAIEIERAEGRVCADIVSACPPGSAIIVPGQMIDAHAIEYAADCAGVKFVRVVC